jgi:hypothetical protein
MKDIKHIHKNILIRKHVWDAMNMTHKFRRLDSNIIMCMLMHEIFRNRKDQMGGLGIGGRTILKWNSQS